jgi:beta-lactam-binding protein with PASTA domain
MFRAFGQLRYTLARETQRVANAVYGGENFAAPDQELIKTILTDLPSVVGMSIDEAKKTLEDAGFEAIVGEPVDSNVAEGLVAAQNPGAGKVAGGSAVTINPSNGQGLGVPNVAGLTLRDAKGALRSAGFGNVVDGSCTVDGAAGAQQKATGTDPAAGSLVNRNASIAVNYISLVCGGGGGGPGGGNGGNG